MVGLIVSIYSDVERRRQRDGEEGDLLQLPLPGPGTLIVSFAHSVMEKVKNVHDLSNFLFPLDLHFLLSHRRGFNDNLTQTANLGMGMIKPVILEALTVFEAG